MGFSTDEGVSRGELREELHALEPLHDKEFDKRFKDVMERINKSLDLLLARARARSSLDGGGH